MNKTVGKSVLLWSSVPLVILLICVVLIGGLLSFATDAFSVLDFSWLFNGSQKDFRSWFPNFPVLAFWLVKIFPFGLGVFAAALGLLALRSIRKIKPAAETPSRLERFRHSFSFKGLAAQLLFQAAALAFALLLFLCAYFLLKSGLGGRFEPQFEQQLLLSRGFALVVLLQIGFSIGIQWSAFKRTLVDFLLPLGSPYGLAALRILFFGFMTTVCWGYPHHFQAYFELEPKGLPYMDWYIDLIRLSPLQYAMLCKAGAVVNFFIAIGLFTRPLLVLNAVLVFVIIATPNFYGKLFHQHMWIWIPWILTFSKCADVLSVDAWLKHRTLLPKGIPPSSEYALPVRLIWLTFGVVYFFPGFQKLWVSGFDWALTDSMLNQIYVEWNQHYGWRSVIPIENFPNLAKAGGIGVILFELSFFFLLFDRRTRWFVVIGGLVFHTLTGLLLRIWFPPVLFMYVFFIDWGFLFRSLETKIPAAEADRMLNIRQKLSATVASVLFVGNVICGFLGVYSYPFTSFPGYTNIYSSQLAQLYIEVETAPGNWTDIDQILKKTDYRRENNIPLENALLDAHRSKKLSAYAVEQYWNFLQAGVIELKAVNHIRFEIRTTDLNPKAEQKVLNSELIYSR